MPKKPKPESSPVSLPLSVFTTSFRPRNRRVALRRHPKDPMASQLLFRPEQKLKNSDHADVLAVAHDCRLGLKPGDVVVISRFADSDRVYEGERLLIIPEDDIMAVEEGHGAQRAAAKGKEAGSAAR